jgi:hypothetical protein
VKTSTDFPLTFRDSPQKIIFFGSSPILGFFYHIKSFGSSLQFLEGVLLSFSQLKNPENMSLAP